PTLQYSSRAGSRLFCSSDGANMPLSHRCVEFPDCSLSSRSQRGVMPIKPWIFKKDVPERNAQYPLYVLEPPQQQSSGASNDNMFFACFFQARGRHTGYFSLWSPASMT